MCTKNVKPRIGRTGIDYKADTAHFYKSTSRNVKITNAKSHHLARATRFVPIGNKLHTGIKRSVIILKHNVLYQSFRIVVPLQECQWNSWAWDAHTLSLVLWTPRGINGQTTNMAKKTPYQQIDITSSANQTSISRRTPKKISFFLHIWNAILYIPHPQKPGVLSPATPTRILQGSIKKDYLNIEIAA